MLTATRAENSQNKLINDMLQKQNVKYKRENRNKLLLLF